MLLDVGERYVEHVTGCELWIMPSPNWKASRPAACVLVRLPGHRTPSGIAASGPFLACSLAGATRPAWRLTPALT